MKVLQKEVDEATLYSRSRMQGCPSGAHHLSDGTMPVIVLNGGIAGVRRRR